MAGYNQPRSFSINPSLSSKCWVLTQSTTLSRPVRGRPRATSPTDKRAPVTISSTRAPQIRTCSLHSRSLQLTITCSFSRGPWATTRLKPTHPCSTTQIASTRSSQTAYLGKPRAHQSRESYSECSWIRERVQSLLDQQLVYLPRNRCKVLEQIYQRVNIRDQPKVRQQDRSAHLKQKISL